MDDVIDKLEATVVACTSFNSNSVHFDYVRTEDYGTYDPICLLSLQRDTIDSIGPKETRHILSFQVKISHVGTGTKTDLSSIISYTSEIISGIESNRTLNSSYIENVEIVGVEYSQNAPPNYVIYFAFLSIEVELLRNV